MITSQLQCIVVLLGLGLPLGGVAAQSAATPARTVREFLVVGRAETAQVTLDYPTNIAATDAFWQVRPQLLVPGAAPPATLRTTLPISIGLVAVAPGTYRLWGAVENERMVLIATSEGEEPTASAAIRIPLERQDMGSATTPIALAIVSKRNGADTLVFGYRTAHNTSVVDVRLSPGTTSRLVIDHGRWRLTAPVTAR
jgi:hypothetical protein